LRVSTRKFLEPKGTGRGEKGKVGWGREELGGQRNEMCLGQGWRLDLDNGKKSLERKKKKKKKKKISTSERQREEEKKNCRCGELHWGVGKKKWSKLAWYRGEYWEKNMS